MPGLSEPYEKWRSLPGVQKFLKEGITLELLEKIAEKYSDNEMAQKVQPPRDQLFDKIVAAWLYLSGSYLD